MRNRQGGYRRRSLRLTKSTDDRYKQTVKNRSRAYITACLFLLLTLAAQSQTSHAAGTFDVKLTPHSADDKDLPLARMTIDKQFHGDLEGTSKGEMLAASTGVKNSAGYVALERVSGKLKGRTGTFILQHSATMDRGKPFLSITVVPDSGTDELVGLAGKMNIKIAPDGKHSYEFEYTLPIP